MKSLAHILQQMAAEDRKTAAQARYYELLAQPFPILEPPKIRCPILFVRSKEWEA
jgi:hypothetical protein